MGETSRKLSLEELTIIARDVLREDGLLFEVVGAVASPRDGEYAEIILAAEPAGGTPAVRLTIGILRTQSVERIRAQITQKVRP